MQCALEFKVRKFLGGSGKRDVDVGKLMQMLIKGGSPNTEAKMQEKEFEELQSFVSNKMNST